MTTSLSQPASLQEATRKSTLEWKANLKSLFEYAKDRFPDVVWELTAEDDYEDKVLEEVWGHKAIVYARAPPSFQSRYFSFKPSPLSASYPYQSSPPPGYSAESTPSLTDEDQRVASPVPSSIQPQSGGILRIRTSINSTLFSNELGYLYTGQGFEAFEFLYESFESRLSEPRPEGDAEEARIDKLRKDLVFMWRSRLYSDVRISLTGNFSSYPNEDTTAFFSSHRFILVSRCPYFYNALLSWSKPKSQQNNNINNNEPFTLSLPSPPFTPASLHFTLGFIYTGTLIFSNRNYDLNTAFSILRSATYLSLETLCDEIQARIIQEMMHGLSHAFLSFPEYESLTGGKWGTGGCRCRQCARRAPRVLEFAIADDVKNVYLDRGARRALVGLFGEGWCTSEFASLPQKLRESVLKGVGKRTTPENVFPLLFAAEHALVKLNPVIDPWADIVREMIESGRRGIDEVLCNHPEACFSQHDWLEIMENDGVHFEDGERVEWIMKSLLRGVNDKNAPMLYQSLVSSVLLRTSLADPNQAMLSPTSHIRVQVEQAQSDILARIGKRWLNIRQEGGFDDLEGWAAKEISDAINVLVEDLLVPMPKGSALRVRNTTRDGEGDAASIRVNVLNRSLHSKRNTLTRERASDVASSSASVYSARSNFSTATNVRRTTTAGNVKNSLNTAASRASLRKVSSPDPRPDSKLTPASDSSRLNGSRTPSPTRPSVVPENQEEATEDDDAKGNTGADEQDDIETSTDGHTYESFAEDTSSQADYSAETNSIASSVSMQKTLINRIVIPPSISSPVSRSMRRNGSAISRASTFTTDISSSSQSLRPKSSASSIRSTTSTLRKASGSGSLRSTAARQGPPKSSLSARPISSVSTSSTSENATYRTASTYSSTTASAVTARSRRLSTSSTLSTRTTPAPGGDSGGASPSSVTSSPVHLTVGSGVRSRRSSGASTHSINTITTSKARSVSGPTIDRKRPLTPGSAMTARKSASMTASTKSTPSTSLSPAREKKGSMTRLRTTSSTGKSSVGLQKKNEDPPQRGKDKQGGSSPATASGDPSDQHKKTESTSSTATLKTRRSNETITSKGKSPSGKSPVVTKGTLPPLPADEQTRAEDAMDVSYTSPTKDTLSLAPKGATLEIGIPCIITSKRKRFKAYARYIGEVEGELGPWVGVEVPLGSGDSWAWTTEQEEGNGNDGRQWHDGTWGGIRYFDIGGTASEWDYSEDRSKRRRMGDSSNSKLDKGHLKRDRDQLSVTDYDRAAKRIRSASPAVSDVSGVESRGLFVRPQQVLYVIDAVGTDY
ncbi:hypothetical protein M378DRAFT_181318 [Amanita muscaria Koide BX008]|uniref:BTB domain-containing protein n=1 Tax=Amanita muscaria (strain Koide BX008) TaxID=946122 RepID=A0A0C2S6D3_AMAMK|nr:hypothetical protein M378DRAFT_181318 [Amanita muscaria Koide BX008]